MSDNPYCRGESCGMQIRWVECVRRDGKLSRMPLDVDQFEVELTVVGEDGDSIALDPKELKGKFVFLDALGQGSFVRAAVCGDAGPFHTGHHSTCPDAASFRGKK